MQDKPPEGKLMREYLHKGLRELHCAEHKEDIVILYQKLPDDFLTYQKVIKKQIPHILFPKRIKSPLNFAKQILQDNDLLKQIKKIIQDNAFFSYKIEAYMNTDEIFKIAQILNVGVLYNSAEQYQSGFIYNLNNKAKFIKNCQKLNIKHPGSKIVNSKKEAIKKALNIYKKQHCGIMLRQTNKACSQGNYPIPADLKLNVQTIKKNISNLSSEWWQSPLLVEPFLQIIDSPCNLVKLPESSKEKIKIAMLGTQFFSEKFYGAICPPSYSKKIINKLNSQLIKYCRYIRKSGACGWVDIDWVFTKNKEIIAIESNYRMTGWTNLIYLMNSFFGEDQRNWPAFFSSDHYQIRKKLIFSEVINNLKKQKLLFSQKNKKGVFISNALMNNYLGLIVFANNAREVREILNQIKWLN